MEHALESQPETRRGLEAIVARPSGAFDSPVATEKPDRERGARTWSRR